MEVISSDGEVSRYGCGERGMGYKRTSGLRAVALAAVGAAAMSFSPVRG